MSRRKIWPIFSATTISAICCPTRASRRAWRTRISWSTPTRGHYILTLYEKRVAPEDLPFFLGLMEHLAARGLNCPQPVKNRAGCAARLRGGPSGRHRDVPRRACGSRRPSAVALRARSARRSRSCTLRARDFPMRRRNALSVDGWRPLCVAAAAGADEVQPGLREHDRARARRCSKAHGRAGLPEGVIHADLFPDNVFFLGDQLSGLIDFYFACTDTLAYDIAICLNAWCFEPDHSYNVTKGARAAAGLCARASALGRGARAPAAARARRGAALPAHAPRRLAQRAARRAGASEGPARIFPQAALPPGGQQRARLRDRRMSEKPRARVTIYTDGGCAPAIPGRAAGRAILIKANT